MRAVFNERFAMKTILDYDIFSDDFEPKPVYYQCMSHHVIVNTLVMQRGTKKRCSGVYWGG